MRNLPTFLVRGRYSTLFALAVAAGLTAACEGPAPDPYLAVAHRLIDEPTEEVFDLTSLRRSYGYQRQTFEDVDQLRRWRTHDAAERVVEDGMLTVKPSGEGGQYIRLSHEIEFFAEDVQEIVIVAKGLREGLLRLYWAIPGSGFVHERGQWQEGRGAGEVTYRFKVAEHPEWRGRIRALRLDVPNFAGQDVSLRSFETRGREGYEAEMLAQIIAQNWKVEAGYEARNAVLTPPDVPREWALPEPTAGKLRFAYSLPRIPAGVESSAIEFKITGGTGDERRVLFEDSLDPQDEARAGRWLEAEIDLAAGESEASTISELVFETSAGANYQLDAGLPAWAHPEILTLTRTERRPNIVVISIDTLRADRLGVYGYGGSPPFGDGTGFETSPNIDRWARSKAVTFRRAVATAPWTLPAHVSMLSGLDALHHGVNHHLPAPRELDLLAEMLRRQGYLTAAVTGGGWLHPDQGLAQGFDVFRFWGRGTAGEQELEAGLERALELLEEGRDRELFLFFHTYEAHDPFRHRLPWAENCPPAPEEGMLYGAVEEERKKEDGFPLRYGFRKWRPGQSAVAQGQRVGDDELALVSCLYDSGIAYTDHHLARLFERLEALDTERPTLVVLTSDHGESLGEHGFVKHAYLLDSNLLVPLIIDLPGDRHDGETVEAQVSLVDLVPTILDVAGVEASAGMDGESLLSLISDGPSGSRQAWSYAGSSNFGLSLRLDNRAKYVYNNTAWTPLGGGDELYDLKADIDELDNQASSQPQRVEPLRARAVDALESLAQGVLVELENHSCGELIGELVGLPVHISRVKAARPPGERFDWVTKRRGAFRLQPGERLDLLLEAARGTVTVEGRLGPCAGTSSEFRQPIDLDRLETWGLGFDGNAWQEGLAEETPEAGGRSQARVALRREGRKITDPRDSPELDSALVEQLQALGYVTD